MKEQIKIGEGKMTIKGQFLADENSLKIRKGELSLRNIPKSIVVYYTYDSDPKKPIGKAYNFKYRKGQLFCDVEMPALTKDSPPVAIVPVIEGEQDANGIIVNVKLLHCMLTQNPMDSRCYLKF